MGEDGLKSGYKFFGIEEVTKGFTVSASPKPISLGTFLFGTRKYHSFRNETTTPDKKAVS